jgi:hypothetical protein
MISPFSEAGTDTVQVFCNDLSRILIPYSLLAYKPTLDLDESKKKHLFRCPFY